MKKTKRDLPQPRDARILEAVPSPAARGNLARKNYQLWREEPFHPSLNFKKIGRGKWSVRVGIHYRAVGKFEGSGFVWDWIGTHGEYDRLA